MELTFIVDIGLATIGFMVGRRNSDFMAYIVELVNYFLYYIAVPMVIFVGVLNAPSINFYVFFIVLSILHICVLMVSSFLFSPIISSNPKDRMTIVVLSSLPNAGYLAIPLATLLLGTGYYVTPYTVAFNIVFSFITLFIALRTSRGNTLDVVKSFPPILAIIITMIIKTCTLDIGGIVNSVSAFTSYVIRMSFFVIGYGLANLTYSSLRSLVRPLAVVALIKIPYSLIIARAILSFVTAPSEFVRGFMLQSIMPPAVNNIIIAKMFKLNEDLMAVSITVLTLVSVILSSTLFTLLL
ncbi:MAG: AEC family transporter [Ignisphaera sp.]